MLELMKTLNFIPESRAIKISAYPGIWVSGERYDKVTYLTEFLDLEVEGTFPVYVEADKFLALLPFIKKATAKENYLQVILRNGADYKLPYLEVEFEEPELRDVERLAERIVKGNVSLEILKKTALQNLVKPEMRCIYVDERGAISCNFLQGTFDKRLKSTRPILLPPDMTDYIKDGECEIFTDGVNLLYRSSKCRIVSPVADFSEEESPWYESIYSQVEEEMDKEFSQMQEGTAEALKRLSYFGKGIRFYPDKMVSGESVEPIHVPSAQGGEFDLEEISSVIPYGKEIRFSQGKAVLKADEVYILISEKEEEE